MPFKKNNIKKASPLIPNIIWLVALSLIFLLWLVLIKNIDFFTFQLDENDKLNPIIEPINNQEDLIKSINIDENDENKINILVIWRWWWDHDAPNLTDTIILASINIETKLISMLSIPRDLFVEYPLNDINWKINWLYAKYRFENNSEEAWIDVLKKKITEITWEKIDYFINLDFNWFTEIIDTIWWIEITIPSHFIDDQYPDWNWGYKTLVFKKWTWIFDWENALKYARSRHSTSDFDRSIRQQQVIKAIKEKLTWGYFFTSPWKIKELYEVFVNHVYTDLNLKTIVRIAYNLNWASEFKIASSNLNDTCYYWSNTCEKWWFLYTPSRELFWGMSVLLAEWTDGDNLNNYSKLQNFTNIVFNSPEVFTEEYKINIFNSLKINHLAWALSNDIVRYWFNIPSKDSIWNTSQAYDKSVIYYNNIDSDSKILRTLKNFFNWEFKEINLPKYSNSNANIEIIIWQDYLWDNSPFTF